MTPLRAGGLARPPLALLAAALPLLSGCSPSGQPSPAASAVAVVGGRTVSRAQFDLRLGTAQSVIGQSGGAAAGAHREAMVRELRSKVMASLILDTVIADEAAFHHLEADDGAVDAELAADARAAGGGDALQTQLAEAGGSLAQRRDEARSSLNERRLEDYFAAQRAGEAERALAAGAPFAQVAAQYSDDDTSPAAAGAAATLTADQLRVGDPAFAAALRSLQPGRSLPSPARDASGYEILLLDAAGPAGWTFNRILVAAPQPYTVRQRPRWFEASLFAAVQESCARGRIRILAAGVGTSPCDQASPSPGSSPAHP